MPSVWNSFIPSTLGHLLLTLWISAVWSWTTCLPVGTDMTFWRPSISHHVPQTVEVWWYLLNEHVKNPPNFLSASSDPFSAGLHWSLSLLDRKRGPSCCPRLIQPQEPLLTLLPRHPPPFLPRFLQSLPTFIRCSASTSNISTKISIIYLHKK